MTRPRLRAGEPPHPALIEALAADVNALRQELGITFEQAYDEIAKPDWVRQYKGTKTDLENQVISKAKSIARGRSRLREGHRVADFNTFEDLITHARDEGATHVIRSKYRGGSRIFYPPTSSGKYPMALVRHRDGYWHTQAPSEREIILKLPEDAVPIEGRNASKQLMGREMRWASEAPRTPRAPRYSAHQSEDNALIDFVFRGEEKIGYIAGPFSNSKGTVYKWKLYSIPNQKSLPFGMSGIDGEARSRQTALDKLVGADKALTTRRTEHFPETVSEAPRRSAHRRTR